MRNIPKLELHVSHACNLTCESCSHYSNQGHRGIVTVEEAESWMAGWSRRIQPQTLSLLGGEPTINPRLPEFVDLARRYWPRSRLRLATNGFFLHKHPELPLAIKRHPNAFISISLHHHAADYRAKLAPIDQLLKGWMKEHGIKVVADDSVNHWTRRYKGYGSGMEPYDDHEPRKSWEACPARTGMQIFENKLWKCAPLAYLGMQHALHGLSAKWDAYLAYRPLELEATDAEIDAFCRREDESACNMCPAHPETFKLPNPLRPVTHIKALHKAEPAKQGAGA